MRRTHLGIATLGFTIALLAVGTAFATPPIEFETGTYTLGNHIDGNQAPPEYGARLDGLHGQGVFLFDFECDDCSMTMVYDGSTIHISGEALGGHKDGNDFEEDDEFGGMYEWDILYSTVPNAVVDVENDDTDLQDIGVLAANQMNAAGTLEFLDGDGLWALTDKAGSHPFSLRVGDESDDNGHRGQPGISGWGWLMFTEIVNVQALNDFDSLNFQDPSGAQDFLFSAEKVPEVPAPATVALLILGLAALGRTRRNG